MLICCVTSLGAHSAAFDDFLARYHEYTRTFGAQPFETRPDRERTDFEDALGIDVLDAGDQSKAALYINRLVAMTKNIHGPYSASTSSPYKASPVGWTVIEQGAPEYGYWVPWTEQALGYPLQAGQIRFKAHIDDEALLLIRYESSAGTEEVVTCRLANDVYDQASYPWHHVRVDGNQIWLGRRKSSRSSSKIVQSISLPDNYQRLISFGFGKSNSEVACISGVHVMVYMHMHQFHAFADAYEASLSEKSYQELSEITIESIEDSLFLNHVNGYTREARQRVNKIKLLVSVIAFEKVLTDLLSNEYLDGLSKEECAALLEPGVIELFLLAERGVSYDEIREYVADQYEMEERLRQALISTRERVSNRIYGLPDHGEVRFDETLTHHIVEPVLPSPLRFEWYGVPSTAGILRIDLDFYSYEGEPLERVAIELRRPPAVGRSQVNVISISADTNGDFTINNGRMRYQLTELFDEQVPRANWCYYHVEMAEKGVSIEFVARDEYGGVRAQGSLTDDTSPYLFSRTNLYAEHASSHAPHTPPSVSKLALGAYTVSPALSRQRGAGYSHPLFHDNTATALRLFLEFQERVEQQFSSTQIELLPEEQVSELLADDAQLLKDTLIYQKTGPLQGDRLLEVLSHHGLSEVYDQAVIIFNTVLTQLQEASFANIRAGLLLLREALQANYSSDIIEGMSRAELIAFNTSAVAAEHSYYEVIYRSEGIPELASLRDEVVTIFDGIVAAIVARLAQDEDPSSVSFAQKLQAALDDEDFFQKHVPSRERVIGEITAYAKSAESVKAMLLLQQQEIWKESIRNSAWYEHEARHAEKVDVVTRFLSQVYELLVDLTCHHRLPGVVWRSFKARRKSFEDRLLLN